MPSLLDFLQGASNAAAGTVSGPVDLIGYGLRSLGVPVPENAFGGSQWMRNAGLTREPESRLAGLLGESAGMALPVVAAAKAPQIAGGLLRLMDNAMAPTPMNTASGRQAGALYFRRTHGPDPQGGVDYMMFARNHDDVRGGNYGQTLHTFNDASPTAAGKIADATDPKFQSRVAAALRSDPQIVAEYGRNNLRSLAAETNPDSIVNSAGLWDNPDLARVVWDKVLDPAGKTVVRTADGAIVFDPALVRTRGTYPRGY